MQLDFGSLNAFKMLGILRLVLNSCLDNEKL